jgi:hypothetical protein
MPKSGYTALGANSSSHARSLFGVQWVVALWQMHRSAPREDSLYL